jgi:hypothetical protein
MISRMVPAGQHIVEAAANGIFILLIFVYLAARAFRYRNVPRVGGKIGPRRKIKPAEPIPAGFSALYKRSVTVGTPPTDAVSHPDLKSFLRHGVTQRRIQMRVYRVSGCKSEIEMPMEAPDYERIDAAEALELLRELPDPRLIRRLHLSDERCFVDPWVRKLRGQQYFTLGHATNFRLVVLYRPDRRLREIVGHTLLHEWLHIVAFASYVTVWRFTRANAVEPLVPAAIEPVFNRGRRTTIYEAWSDLGEQLFGYDEKVAREAALTSPVHATILWRRVEKIMRKTPARLRSSRFAEWERRAAFMQAEVGPKAKAIQRKR